MSKKQIVVTWELDEESEGREGEIVRLIQDGLFDLGDGGHFDDKDVPFDSCNFKIRVDTK